MKPRHKFALLFCVTAPLLACGPWFPNRLLDQGDEAVLAAPYARFFREIQRMDLVKTAPVAKPLTVNQSHADQTLEAELQDLQSALSASGLPDNKREEIVRLFQIERRKISKPAKEPDLASPHTASPRLQPLVLPDGLPDEFEQYLRGAADWAAQQTNAAIAHWEKLLRLEPKQRQFKSTWAAYMLGRALLQTDPKRAANYFQQTRSLAQKRFSDSLGLAAASLGWEAKILYDREQFLPAAELYLEQSGTGDISAVVSLKWIAGKVLTKGGEGLASFARHPKLQRVITAYLLENHNEAFEPFLELPLTQPAAAWLSAVEAAGQTNIAAAEQLALASYRYGEIDRARRWLKLAKTTPVAQWLEAKLLLRDGKSDQAAALLAKLTVTFPLDWNPDSRSLQESLYFEDERAEDRLWGELGALRLARREYAEALDALLRSGYWDDAAYVAERLLTLDELKQFVDFRWSNDPQLEKPSASEDIPDSVRAYRERLAVTQRQLFHLLARRLIRHNRGIEARPFIPLEHLKDYDELMAALRDAADASQPDETRAQRFMAAARIARWRGLELIGTELAPDYAVHRGNFESGITPETRLNPFNPFSSDDNRNSPQILKPSNDELRRAADPPADPFIRFHYRYVAADLAWTAAHLLPNNSQEKAWFLCEGGSWIKYSHPTAADHFYKELVRTCRQTDIGQLADSIRWFPLLDEQGKLKPNQPKPPSPTPPEFE